MANAPRGCAMAMGAGAEDERCASRTVANQNVYGS
jgi:hypothetical protein